MSFTDWPWRHWRAQFTDKPALRLNDEVLSWQQLCARIDSLAAGFHRQGVEEGDGVLLLAHNHPHTLLACSVRSETQVAHERFMRLGCAYVGGRNTRHAMQLRRA